MKNSLLITLTAAALAALNVWQCRQHTAVTPQHHYRTDTVTVRETITAHIPVPQHEHTIRTDTVRLPILRTDTLVIHDTLRVLVPIVQRTYSTPQYRAVISGYNPTLDSIQLYPLTRTVTLTRSPKRWGIGIQAGYSLTPHGLAPTIGIGISYNLLQW